MAIKYVIGRYEASDRVDPYTNTMAVPGLAQPKWINIITIFFAFLLGAIFTGTFLIGIG